jgi:hypothetical protein
LKGVMEKLIAMNVKVQENGDDQTKHCPK